MFISKILQELGTPHIDSFNYMIDEGLNLAVTDLLPVEFDTKGKYRVKLVLVVIGHFLILTIIVS